MKLSALDIG